MSVLRAVVAFMCFASVFIVPRAGADGCSETEAFNKMLALNRAQARMQAGGGAVSPKNPSVKLLLECAEVSQLLVQKKYDLACSKYDEIAKKYEIDLAKEHVGLVTYEELQKDGGKRGGICSQSEAHEKVMAFHEQIEAKVKVSALLPNAFRTFSEDTTKLGELMFTDPSEMCRKLDELKKKYKLE